MLTQVTSVTTTSILSIAPHEEEDIAPEHTEEVERDDVAQLGLALEQVRSATAGRPHQPGTHHAARDAVEGVVAAAARTVGARSEDAAIGQAMASLDTATAAAAAAAAASNPTATTAATQAIDDLYADDYGYDGSGQVWRVHTGMFLENLL
jgi:hypothetical protein